MKHNILTFLPPLLAAILLTVLAAIFAATGSLNDVYTADVKRDLAVRTSLLMPYCQDIIAGKSAQLPPELLAVTRLTIIQADTGNVVWDSQEETDKLDNHLNRPEIQAALQSEGSSFNKRFSSTLNLNMLYCTRVMPYNQQKYIIRTAVSVQSINTVVKEMRRNVLLATLLGIIGAFILTYLVFVSFTRPARNLVMAARRIAAGELTATLPIPKRGAIRELALSLTTMTSQLMYNIIRISREKSERDAVFSALSEGVVLLDENHRIVDINQAALNIFSFNGKLPLQQEFFALVRNIELERFISRQAAVNGATHEHEFTVSLPSGDRQLRIRAARLHWSDTDSGIMLVIYNLTKLRKLENYRRDFIANVSHEIKTPLTAIQGAVETLQDGAIDDAAAAPRFMQIVSANTKRLTALVEDILALTNLENRILDADSDLETLNPLEFVSTAVELCTAAAQSRHSTLEIQDHAPERLMCGNRRQLEQLIINLLNNAIKYSVEHDNIIVEIKTVNQNKTLQIQVIDHGAGIAPEHLSRIFERFYRVDKSRSRAAGGTGLGLAIVKHTALLHHGSVEVASTLNQGTTFTVKLPLLANDAENI